MGLVWQRLPATLQLAGFVRGLERVGGFGGKSDALAESEVFLGAPDAYRQTLSRIDAASGAQLVSLTLRRPCAVNFGDPAMKIASAPELLRDTTWESTVGSVAS